jgi:regulator of replication initiation timing
MQNILIGVAIGFTPMLVLLIIQLAKQSQKQKEHTEAINKLKAMLTDRMDLESDGIGKLKEENAELKVQNENLRISLRTYSQKPGRREVARLQVFQQAADRLTINSPGFGAAWQAALKESESEFEKTFYGVQPFIKRIIPLKNSNANVVGRIDQD